MASILERLDLHSALTHSFQPVAPGHPGCVESETGFAFRSEHDHTSRARGAPGVRADRGAHVERFLAVREALITPWVRNARGGAAAMRAAADKVERGDLVPDEAFEQAKLAAEIATAIAGGGAVQKGIGSALTSIPRVGASPIASGVAESVAGGAGAAASELLTNKDLDTILEV